MSNNHFLCPHCSGHLKVGEYIVLTARNNKKEKGLLLLHPEIGNYSSLKHPKFEYKIGDSIDFFCPLCQHELHSDIDDKLVFVNMIDSNGKEFDIYFSRIAGEQSTFQVSGETVMETGEHSDRYTYFKMSHKFKRFLKK